MGQRLGSAQLERKRKGQSAQRSIAHHYGSRVCADNAKTRPVPPPSHRPYTPNASRAPKTFRTGYVSLAGNHDIYLDKLKRFFSIRRVFQTVWFEPGGEDKTPQRSDISWTRDCPAFHDQKPYAKYRFFVVLRKRLHYTLCFSITTAENRTGRPEAHGRLKDSVVLYSSKLEPPRPAPVEGIKRKPIGIILEDDNTAITPFTRLNCGRIFTKIGRVHPDFIGLLEEYYKEAVA
ncbi:hypothetical protein QBC46DRAFT_364913 [Diplogelasinospora grovesii]|uniref:DUF6590 domain-containing protein n=1 Tax=Diplogelasinospora grovesii TaxID=303347 RepID=A0AAN6N7V3_9PEZI|nr:hypothetical protein QBC46DRAFT_364913 [Diplogelasinospora grovesii]